MLLHTWDKIGIDKRSERDKGHVVKKVMWVYNSTQPSNDETGEGQWEGFEVLVPS